MLYLLSQGPNFKQLGPSMAKQPRTFCFFIQDNFWVNWGRFFHFKFSKAYYVWFLNITFYLNLHLHFLFLWQTALYISVLAFLKMSFCELGCFDMKGLICFMQKIVLNKFRLSKKEQDFSHKWYMWFGILAVSLNLVSMILLCLATFLCLSSSMILGPGQPFYLSAI